MALVYLSLGTNLGNKKENINKAIQALDGKIGTLVKCSSFFETEPWGFVSENTFINAAAIYSTTLSMEEILTLTESTEKLLGRNHKSSHQMYSDRIIDIDILLYDNEISSSEKLTVPHPLMHQRTFVLEPLVEIAPNVIHPILKKSMFQLLQELSC